MISRTSILSPDGTCMSSGGERVPQPKTTGCSAACMPPAWAHLCTIWGPALGMSLSCSEAFSGSLVLCEIKSKLLSLAFETFHDLAPGQCFPLSTTTSPPLLVIWLGSAPRQSPGLFGPCPCPRALPLPQPARPLLPSLLIPTLQGPA